MGKAFQLKKKKELHCLVCKIDDYLRILPKITKSFQIAQNQFMHGTVPHTYFQIDAVSASQGWSCF